MQQFRPFTRDPHEYGMEMARIVNYLKTGQRDLTGEDIDEAKRARERAEAAARKAAGLK
jgi:hypothetical protein